MSAPWAPTWASVKVSGNEKPKPLHIAPPRTVHSHHPSSPLLHLSSRSPSDIVKVINGVKTREQMADVFRSQLGVEPVELKDS
jgi:hypothetical protein